MAFTLLPLLLLTAPFTLAEIYKLVPGAGLCERLGYDLAYTAPVEINGTKATVYVWHSDANIHRTLLKIQEAHRAKNHPEGFAADKGTGFGMVVDGTTLVRYLAVTLDETRDTTVLYQTNCALADFMAGASGPPGAPPARPRHHQLDAIPVPGNASPLSHAIDKGTGMTIEVSTLPERHALALSWYERTMPGSGWQPGPKSTENTQLYVRGRERAMISIAVGEKETTLTRVHHKRGSFFK